MPRNTSRGYVSRHVRNRTGLRNKVRHARSRYPRNGKADYYGKWENGKCLTPERIAR